ncbi:MAG TPA: DUF6714 family protein [Gemmata sp.]|jgi:hypothetical protein|nr:DUF6714 family protein [Gemmata sp.]
MTSEERRVADLIIAAFRGVTLGEGVGLLQGQGLDDYADDETLKDYRSKDEKQDWTRLRVDSLIACHSSLSFFDAEGMRFHLPAYLLTDLEGTMTQDILFHLTYLGNGATSRFEMLSETQREAVRQFLLLRLDPDDSFTSPLIRAALDSYWLPRQT